MRWVNDYDICYYNNIIINADLFNGFVNIAVF